jgi:diguanylate cyclase (GGDEF)-like protein
VRDPGEIPSRAVAPGLPVSAARPSAEAPDLSRIDLFKGVDLGTVEGLLERCDVRELRPGEVLIAAGKPNRFLYLVLSGRLCVHLHLHDDPITRLEVGESVGEISVIDRLPTSAYVVADGACRVLVLDEEVVWGLVQRSHQVACNLLVVLAQRIRHANSVVAESQQLQREYAYRATVDPLTGLYNRRWLDTVLVREMERHRSEGEPLALLMMDIDDFKRYNDTYGHLAGDRALHTVARELLGRLRPVDMAVRYGGEEFIALLPGADASVACSIAEVVRRAVRATQVFFTDNQVLPAVTVSVGLAVMRAADTTEDLIGAADAALYRAKAAGRNRVVVSERDGRWEALP